MPRGLMHWRQGFFLVLLNLVVLLFFVAVVMWRYTDSQPSDPDFGEPPDFAFLEQVDELKSAFFAYFTPIIEWHNTRIERQRATLLIITDTYRNNGFLNLTERRRLGFLAREYHLDEMQGTQPLLDELWLRVDTVPLELALVQAAKESGWGRSRFTLVANNLFGQWCYRAGCGEIPLNRAAGNRHELEYFDSLSESVRRYMNNLNTHPQYEAFRVLRAAHRAAGFVPRGRELADGLLMYSERRQDYIDEIKLMLEQYDTFNNLSEEID